MNCVYAMTARRESRVVICLVSLLAMLCESGSAQEPTVTIDMSTFTGSPSTAWMSCRDVGFDSQGNIVAGINGSVDLQLALLRLTTTPNAPAGNPRGRPREAEEALPRDGAQYARDGMTLAVKRPATLVGFILNRGQVAPRVGVRRDLHNGELIDRRDPEDVHVILGDGPSGAVGIALNRRDPIEAGPSRNPSPVGVQVVDGSIH
jgi:hypothetical protein